MSSEKLNELVEVDGRAFRHTYRGYDGNIEVYTAQAGNKTYSLYRKPNETIWQCDWTSSYNCQPVALEANASDKDAMLTALVAHLNSLERAGH